MGKSCNVSVRDLAMPTKKCVEGGANLAVYEWLNKSRYS